MLDFFARQTHARKNRETLVNNFKLVYFSEIIFGAVGDVQRLHHRPAHYRLLHKFPYKLLYSVEVDHIQHNCCCASASKAGLLGG